MLDSMLWCTLGPMRCQSAHIPTVFTNKYEFVHCFHFSLEIPPNARLIIHSALNFIHKLATFLTILFSFLHFFLRLFFFQLNLNSRSRNFARYGSILS